MAVTNQNSTQVAAAIASPTVLLEAGDYMGRPNYFTFDFTQDGDGAVGSTAKLVRMPAGRCVILFDLSKMATSAFGASTTLDLGHNGYTQPDGTAVAADADAFVADADVAAAGAVDLGADLDTIARVVIDSATSWDIVATIAGAAIPDEATIDGYIIAVYG